jgi:hypothetical protein
MRIFDITMYRDGGSIEFKVERDGQITQVWPETPLRGEPRELLINSKPVSRGAPDPRQLLADIAQWWSSVPSETRTQVLEALSHKGTFFNPPPEAREATDASRVLQVRDYVALHYVVEQ